MWEAFKSSPHISRYFSLDDMIMVLAWLISAVARGKHISSFFCIILGTTANAKTNSVVKGFSVAILNLDVFSKIFSAMPNVIRFPVLHIAG